MEARPRDQFSDADTPEPVNFVISTLIFDGVSRERVLLGVRQPTPMITRHPGVLSTPTMRVPEEFFRTLSGGSADANVGEVSAAETFQVGRGGFFRDPNAFVVEALLCRKLDMADSLTFGRLSAKGRSRLLANAKVDDPKGTQLSEWTTMLTFEVLVEEGADQFPSSCSTYSPLFWADAVKVPQALSANDALIVDDSLNPFEVCIHGLCVSSASRVIVGNLGRDSGRGVAPTSSI